MGMITRFRARLQSFNAIPKLDQKMRDEKLAETVCLLSVLFLLPYCSKGHTPLLLSLGGWCLASYSCLVLPILISANYKYPASWLRKLILNIPDLIRIYGGPVFHFFRRLYAPLDRCERAFLKLTNLSNMAMQLIFFMLCDRVLLPKPDTIEPPIPNSPPQHRISALYTLMFYNVIAYCVGYIRELIDKEDWSPYVHVTSHGQLRHLAMSATKCVLEWTKAVTFIITVTFMLLILGLEKGLDCYRPTALYMVATWSYFVCTERIFVEEAAPWLVSRLRVASWEALEHLYAPVILRYYTIGLAVLLTTADALLQYSAFYNLVTAFWTSNTTTTEDSHLSFTALAAYLTVYLRTMETRRHHARRLHDERAALGRFRAATRAEIDDCDDVCAVCLGGMEKGARVTPCHHLFHAECLRRCLHTGTAAAPCLCPMCKRDFTFIS